MKHLLKRLLIATILLGVVSTSANSSPVFGKSFFLPVANNGTASSTLGWSSAIHKFDMYNSYGCLKVQSEYSQNTKRREIGQYFSSNNSNSMIWGPEKTATTNLDTDVYTLNFLLNNVPSPTNPPIAAYKAEVAFLPKAQDFVTSFGLFVGLDEWVEGLYLHVNAPLQHARWHVVMNETVITSAGATTFPPQKIDQSATGHVVPYTSVASAFKGDKTIADITEKWKYGKIDGTRSITKLGDVHVTLGWNFVNTDDAHFGLGLKALLGSGGKSQAKYVFEPVIGYAGRQGLGGTMSGGTMVWERGDDHNITMNVNGSAVHIFANTQKRSYDITNCGIWSRYLLVKKMSNIGATNSAYSGVMENFINVGTLDARIGMEVVYDAGLSLCYRHGETTFDVGYQVAGHSKEKWKSWQETIALDTYILYEYNNAYVSQTGNNDNTYESVSITGSIVDSGTVTRVNDSNKATYVLDNDRLNKNTALAPSAVEHCVYAGLNHNWVKSDWTPSLGVFASYHLSGSQNKTFNRWTIGWQGNLSF